MLKYGVARELESAKMLHTAYHEGGHWITVNGVGGSNKRADIIPVGSRSGVTEFSISNRSLEDQLYDILTVCYGGWAAEELSGLSHEGCAGDFAQAEYYSSFLSVLKRGLVSAGEFKNQAKDRAMGIVRGSNRALSTFSWRLFRAGEVTA